MSRRSLVLTGIAGVLIAVVAVLLFGIWPGASSPERDHEQPGPAERASTEAASAKSLLADRQEEKEPVPDPEAEKVIKKVLNVNKGLRAHKVVLSTWTYKSKGEWEQARQAGPRPKAQEQELVYDETRRRYVLAAARGGGQAREVLFSVDVHSFLENRLRYPVRKLVGREVLDGKPCQVLEIAPQGGRPKAILWIGENDGQVVRANVVDGDKLLSQCDFEYGTFQNFALPKRITTYFAHTDAVVVQEYGEHVMGQEER